MASILFFFVNIFASLFTVSFFVVFLLQLLPVALCLNENYKFLSKVACISWISEQKLF